MIGIAILLGAFFFLYITNPLIIIVHELGHALAFLSLTKPQNIDIYVGSYGDKGKYFQFRIGKLHFFIRRSFGLFKGKGLCVSSELERNYLKQIIILLAGPVVTVITAAIVGLVVLNSDAHGAIKLYCFAFVVFSCISLFTNLLPRSHMIGQHVLDSDGRQIAIALKLRSNWSNYVDGISLFNKGVYSDALAKLEPAFSSMPRNQNIIQLMLVTSINAKKYEDADRYSAHLEANFGHSVGDIFKKGYIKSLLNKSEDAIKCFKEVLKVDENHFDALSFLGIELINIGDVHQAEKVLEKAISADAENYRAFGFLGYLQLIKEDLPASKANIDSCIQSSTRFGPAYDFLTLYYLKSGDLNEAKNSLKFACEFGYITQADKFGDRCNLSKYQSEVLREAVIDVQHLLRVN